MARIPYSKFCPRYSIPAYSRNDALSFCLASRLAYEKDTRGRIASTNIRSQVNKWGFSHAECFEFVRGKDIDIQGYIAVSDKFILASFRGSESLPDWLTNLQAVKDPGPWRRTEVHEGFQDAFFVSALKIGQAIGEKRRNQQVWVTGHSLGGALAVILAATLLENNIPVQGLYTFGAPRVGDKSFAKQLDNKLRNKAHWRVVNKGDMVPHLPPEVFFSHAGNRKLLLSEKYRSTSHKDWNRFKRDIWGWMGTVFGDMKLKIAGPHLLDSKNGYLRRL